MYEPISLVRWHFEILPAIMEGRRQFLALTGGKIEPMEIEIELVLYIDGQEISSRRERVTSSSLPLRQDFWAVCENDIKDFRQRINAREEPPF